jgi:hypothetical protein
MIFLGNQLGTKAFAGSALSDQRIYLNSLQFPEGILKNSIHGFHYTEILVQ